MLRKQESFSKNIGNFQKLLYANSKIELENSEQAFQKKKIAIDGKIILYLDKVIFDKYELVIKAR